jgi:hypothetical protein
VGKRMADKDSAYISKLTPELEFPVRSDTVTIVMSRWARKRVPRTSDDLPLVPRIALSPLAPSLPLAYLLEDGTRRLPPIAPPFYLKTVKVPRGYGRSPKIAHFACYG